MESPKVHGGEIFGGLILRYLATLLHYLTILSYSLTISFNPYNTFALPRNTFALHLFHDGRLTSTLRVASVMQKNATACGHRGRGSPSAVAA